MKTADLTGLALDWAVATANGDTFTLAHEDWDWYSSSWEYGGPIIESRGMGLWMYQWNEQGEPEDGWYAEDKDGDHVRTGPTPLIAAMRCYVASKLGDEIDLPKELT